MDIFFYIGVSPLSNYREKDFLSTFALPRFEVSTSQLGLKDQTQQSNEPNKGQREFDKLGSRDPRGSIKHEKSV